jgi:hypothetical protein
VSMPEPNFLRGEPTGPVRAALVVSVGRFVEAGWEMSFSPSSSVQDPISNVRLWTAMARSHFYYPSEDGFPAHMMLYVSLLFNEESAEPVALSISGDNGPLMVWDEELLIKYLGDIENMSEIPQGGWDCAYLLTPEIVGPMILGYYSMLVERSILETINSIVSAMGNRNN